MDGTKEREYQATVQDLLKEVSLPTAVDQTAVTVAQFSAPIFSPSLVNPTLPMNVSEGTSVSVPVFNSPIQQTMSSGFQGFNFPSSSRPSSIPMPYPGLDGHQRRIILIPVTPTVSQPSVTAVSKSPEQIRREASELIQKLEREKVEQEALVKLYRETSEEEKRKGWEQIPQGVFGARVVEEEKSAGSTSPSNGANRPTIGSTTISMQQAEITREELRETVARAFPGIHEKLLQRGSPSLGSPEKGSEISDFCY